MAKKKGQSSQNTQEDWEERCEQQMKEITERLERGVKDMFTSETYTKYLQTMSKFRSYSFNNTLLIAMQRPDATVVANYDAWMKKNRQVKRGEKGIRIITPVPMKRSEKAEKTDPAAQEPLTGRDGFNVVPRFRVMTVFDVSQTYGDPIPELAVPKLLGNVENYDAFMRAIREVSPVPIRFDKSKGASKGSYSYTNKKIVIWEGRSREQTMKILIHEVTHAMLYDRDIMEKLGDPKNRRTAEVETESAAYTICHYFGLDTSDYSFPYIADWSSDLDMHELRRSMDTVRKTAGKFIDSMTKAINRTLKEQQNTLHEYDRTRKYAGRIGVRDKATVPINDMRDARGEGNKTDRAQAEPDGQEEGAEEKTYPPVYRETLTYARDRVGIDEFLNSWKLNVDCKQAVEAAIREHFDGSSLDENAVDPVLEEYGQERLSYVLACTVQHKSWDRRFSENTKAWAEGIPVPEVIEKGQDLNLNYVVESHPAVLDEFIETARKKFEGLEREERKGMALTEKAEDSGRKKSVLQMLRDRQAKLKARENPGTGKEPQTHRKGEQEL